MGTPREDLTDVLALLVDAPEEVDVRQGEGQHGPYLEVAVGDDDLGKVIGRQGRTARAIRCVLAGRAAPGDDPIDIKILDD